MGFLFINIYYKMVQLSRMIYNGYRKGADNLKNYRVLKEFHDSLHKRKLLVGEVIALSDEMEKHYTTSLQPFGGGFLEEIKPKKRRKAKVKEVDDALSDV